MYVEISDRLKVILSLDIVQRMDVWHGYNFFSALESG